MDSSRASLKKLKREAAQKRKAQARSLKLHSEEQERLQRLEIDALVEQQRIQRLGNQETKENVQSKRVLCVGSSHHGFKQGESSTGSSKGRDLKTSDKTQEGKIQQVQQEERRQRKQLQLQQMRAVVETRRRLARGSRTMLPSTSLPAEPSSLSSQDSIALPLEDHRVVSTEYQAAGTQALMRVTLLAAGFVIGARGISARLIGQTTGAIIQSWTESSASSGVPIRLFRIQGRKTMVQAAVSLVEQAVAKYKELCECKRRGEFVQREHIINGVEFYYQPPPRKTLAATCADQSPGTTNLSLPSSSTPVASVPAAGNEVPSLAFPPHQVWLQHLHQTQKQKQQAQMQQQQEPSSRQDDDAERRELSSLVAKSGRALQGCEDSRPSGLAVDQMKQVVVSPGSPWKRSSGLASSLDCSAPGSSLFSVFGGLPLPIEQDCQQDSSTAPQFLKSFVSSTPFDFPNFDLFGEILPSTSLKDRQRQPGCVRQQSKEFCMVCVERRSSARLMTCGHASFCSSCVQELSKCPVCLERIVGWQPLKNGS